MNKVADLCLQLNIWDFILNFPREYRKRYLLRLERRIHFQREHIKNLEDTLLKTQKYFTMYRMEIARLKHKPNTQTKEVDCE